MINLLPENEKRFLQQEKQWKILMNLGFLALFFLVCLLLILFSVNAFLLGELESQKILFSQREIEFNQGKLQETQNEVIASNKALTDLNSFYGKQFSLTGAINEISKTLPNGSYLSSLIFKKDEGKAITFQFSLFGFSPDRATLLEFKKNLERDDSFTNIVFPPINWVTKEDINFSTTFEMTN